MFLKSGVISGQKRNYSRIRIYRTRLYRIIGYIKFRSPIVQNNRIFLVYIYRISEISDKFRRPQKSCISEFYCNSVPDFAASHCRVLSAIYLNIPMNSSDVRYVDQQLWIIKPERAICVQCAIVTLFTTSVLYDINGALRSPITLWLFLVTWFYELPEYAD